MTVDIANKWALVTGASRSAGQRIALLRQFPARL
jgi:short-subunit dehydrogenase